VQVLDIGCGDGILTEQILKIDENAVGTLVDGSPDMLEKAKKRLAPYSKNNYIESTFQKLIKNDLNANYDFVVSSLAIHHLSMDQKRSLFQYIYNHLNLYGLFLNIDTVKAPFDDLERFYLTLWKEWIIEKGTKNDIFKKFQHIPNQYENNPDNHPDTLKKQLNALKLIGFKNIDCYYKYGIFTIYGGQKKESSKN
jgi:tRNA (cmo5U34)-methyltransferase